MSKAFFDGTSSFAGRRAIAVYQLDEPLRGFQQKLWIYRNKSSKKSGFLSG